MLVALVVLGLLADRSAESLARRLDRPFPVARAVQASVPISTSETIVAIQVHGNTLTPDADIVRMAGVAVGAPFEADTIARATARLHDAKRFDSVQVLKRFASIADPTQVLLVIVVDEGPVKIERTGDPNQPARTVRSRTFNLMFLPVLTAEDGYGLTYGARFALPNPAGKESRVAFPLTWGGEKRAAAEFDKSLARGPFDRIYAGASVSRRENPFFERDDDRTRVWGRGEQGFGRTLRVGATLGYQRAAFLGAVDTFGYGGADVTFDTRVDPVLPRNAVYARAAWEHDAVAGGIDRLDVDARGYVGLVGQTIVALRAQRSDANASLPPYLKPLLGGMANLRGFRAGTAANDTLVATSAELIVPLTSPVSFGRIGVSAFIDAATSYDKPARLQDQDWKQGVGGSVWFSAAFLRVSVAVAHGLNASTRVHVGANVTF